MILLKSLKKGSLANVKIGIFDTRACLTDINSKFLNFMVKLFGYATDSMEKVISKKGGIPYISSQGFFVKESEGPLKEGELTRATKWASKILL